MHPKLPGPQPAKPQTLRPKINDKIPSQKAREPARERESKSGGFNAGGLGSAPERERERERGGLLPPQAPSKAKQRERERETEREREGEKERGLEYPKADHLMNRWVVGRATCLRVARRPLSPAERKRKR